jgi:tetratricopeptide (TPR) repeat protein
MDELGANSATPIDSDGVDSTQVDRLVDQAWAIATSDPQQSLDLTSEAEAIANRLGYKRGQAYCQRNTAYSFLMLSELESALPLADKALLGLKAADEPRGVATAIDIKALVYWRLGSYDQALELSYECLAINEDLGDIVGAAWATTWVVFTRKWEIMISRSPLFA